MSPGRRPMGRPSITSSPTQAITRPITTSSLPTAVLPVQIDSRKEVPELERRGFRRVRTVRRIVLDRRAELLAQRSGFSFRRIGGAHERAPLLDRVRGLERQDYDRSRRHEGREAIEKGALAVNG